MAKQKSPFESQHDESYAVDLPMRLFLATHNTKCVYIEMMISISARLSTKPRAHSKSCITCTLLITILRLVREAVKVQWQLL